jgi:hypothetical protein
MRTEERNSVPGKKSFVRLNSANSCINMPNIAYQSWGTLSFAIRLQTMPVKETIFSFTSSNYICNVISTPVNGSTAGIYVSHNFGGAIAAVPTTFQLSLNKWYMFFIHNNGSDLSIYFNGIDELISNRGQASNVRIVAPNRIWLPNATYNPAPGQNRSACNFMIGTKNFASWGSGVEMYSTSSFNYDIAWVHFFEQIVSGDDIYRDAMANWVFTQFTDSSGNYKLLG